MATSGFPEIGNDRAITVRLATGMTSRAVGFLASAVTMPDGEKAIMLAVPAARRQVRAVRRDCGARHRRLTRMAIFIAFVDAGGPSRPPRTVSAASVSCRRDAGRAGRRRRGRTTASSSAWSPARNRLAIRPASCKTDRGSREALLVVIDETSYTRPRPTRRPDNPSAGYRCSCGKQRAGRNAERKMGRQQKRNRLPLGRPRCANRLDSAGACRGADCHLSAEETWRRWATAGDGPSRRLVFRRRPRGRFRQGHIRAVEEAQSVSPRRNRPSPSDGAVEEPEKARSPTWKRQPTATSSRSLPRRPHRAFPSIARRHRCASPGRPTRKAGSVRISDEFADGGRLARGRFDRPQLQGSRAKPRPRHHGEIAGLLERRDTWSGRSVLWPVAGTDLRIPVDLAALPVYDRARKFSGFRGFGVARAGDAVVDPEATGLALAKAKLADDVRRQAKPRRPMRRTARRAKRPRQRRSVQGRSAGAVDRAETGAALYRQGHPPRRAPPAEWREGPVARERVAFREIGDRLKKESGVAAEEGPGQPSLRGDNDQTPPSEPSRRRDDTRAPTGANASEPTGAELRQMWTMPTQATSRTGEARR